MNQDTRVYNQYDPTYPPQQGGYAPYPPQQPAGYPPYPPPSDGKNPPPYADSNTGGGYDPNQMPFQPPPIVPRPQLPKATSDSEYESPPFGHDEQGGEWGNFNGLDNKEIRRIFIRKVYSILMVQLLVTFGIIALFNFTPTVRNYVKSPGGQWAYWTSYAVFLVTYISLICCKSVGRRFPLNLVLLGLLTLAMSYMMGMISAFYTIDSIFLAVGITTFVCLGVTIFSFQTKYDFTSCFGVLFVISLALLGFGFVCIFTYSKILYTVYAGLGAVAFSIFLAVDTQLIMGGKRHEISAEDHVFASIMLYLDVIYIFMYILMLLGKRE